MLFNSSYYIFVFLPVIFFGYFFLQRLNQVTLGKIWLVAGSLFFYSYWNPKYLLLIICSMLVNYAVGRMLHRTNRSKALLASGVVFNLSLLGYFKYTDFFFASINTLLGTDFSLLNLLLPLAISFFTFQQIAYLVDCYQKGTEEYNFLSYCLFVCFFPQLIAGPIVHHREMMPQFARTSSQRLHWGNVACGILVFCIGLFKKVVIADTFAIWANQGYSEVDSLAFVEAWATSLSYTFQLYYDFSGYTDMAIGAALLFNIKLPLNFNSPYKSTSIQEFWRRWHMTLSRWLRDYLYIPLGGNRVGTLRVYTNILITFILGGLWHGAGWTFILWGMLHGLALCVHRLWKETGASLPNFLAWGLTFLFVHVAWVFFRASDVSSAIMVLKAMVGCKGVGNIPLEWNNFGFFYDGWSEVASLGNLMFIGVFALIAFLARNSVEISHGLRRFNLGHVLTVTVALIACILLGVGSTAPEFLYFNF